MNQNTEIALKQAFSLIEAGDLEDAKAILRPILESEKDNADVWWLYSHAVTDPDTARLALNNVLRIEPDYPDARELLNQLEAQQKSDQFDDFPDADKEPVFIPSMPSSIPGIKPLQAKNELSGSTVSDSSADELPDDMFTEEGEDAFYRRPLFYVPLITILLIVALAIVIIKPFAVNSPSPQTTEIPTAQSSALEITPTSEGVGAAVATSTQEEANTSAITPTIEELNTGSTTSTPEALVNDAATNVPATIDNTAIAGESIDFSALVTSFSGFILTTENSVTVSSTNLGQTLGVSICTTAGKEMRTLLPKAMETLAKSSTSYTSQVQAISVKMIDCTSNSTLLWIGSSIDDSVAFANAVVTDKEYQAKWKPVTGN